MGGTRYPAAPIALLAQSGQSWDSPASSEGSARNWSTVGTRFLEEGEGRPEVQVGGSRGHPTLSARAAGVMRRQDGLFWALLPPHPLRSSPGTRPDATLRREERPRPGLPGVRDVGSELPLSRRGPCRRRRRSEAPHTPPPSASAASAGPGACALLPGWSWGRRASCRKCLSTLGAPETRGDWSLVGRDSASH